jgi:hypothetical protein
MSGRIRSFKPEWLDDEEFNACGDAAVRLSFAIMSMVDDKGRAKASVRALGIEAWKFCDRIVDKTAHAQAAVDELVACKWLVGYQAGGYQHWWVRNFLKHQKIDKPKPSRLPAAPGDVCDGVPEIVDESRQISDASPLIADESRLVAPGLGSGIRDQGSGSSGDRPARSPDELVAFAAHVQTEYVRRYRAKLPKAPLPMAARGVPGIGHVIWGELARQAGDEQGCASLLDAAFADGFVAGAGYTPNAIKGAADKLLAIGPTPTGTRARGSPRRVAAMPPIATHEDHARAVLAAGGTDGIVEESI